MLCQKGSASEVAIATHDVTVLNLSILRFYSVLQCGIRRATQSIQSWQESFPSNWINCRYLISVTAPLNQSTLGGLPLLSRSSFLSHHASFPGPSSKNLTNYYYRREHVDLTDMMTRAHSDRRYCVTVLATIQSRLHVSSWRLRHSPDVFLIPGTPCTIKKQKKRLDLAKWQMLLYWPYPTWSWKR